MPPPTPNPDKLTPNDPRVSRQTFTTTSNITYSYLLANPPSPSPPVTTILLLHGFPDLSFGWRHQIPYLLSLNLRVIIPDQIGYGRSDAPTSLEPYSLKHVADDMAQLMAAVLANSTNKRFIIGGHDWGGFLVWRFVLYYPELVQGVFSVCTPYAPPRERFLDLEGVVKMVPNFRYQVQFAGGSVEEGVRGGVVLGRFFRGMFGGRVVGEERRAVFSTERGVDLEVLEGGKGEVGPSPIVSEEEVEFYVREYSRRSGDPPLRGPLNWYRTTRIKWEEELPLARAGVGSERDKVATPALLVLAKRDSALPPSMAKGTERYFRDLTVREVEASHWALVEDPAGVNGHIGEFVKRVLKMEAGREKLKASI